MINSNQSQASSVQPIEQLEGRVLLANASHIDTAFLDNRGQAAFTVSVALNTATLSYKTASFYSAGADAKLGTADDARVKTLVGYRRGRLTLRDQYGTLAVGQQYRIVLNAAVIKDVSGKFLDGEFRGEGVASGNGKGGGNYDVIAKTPSTTRVRMQTDWGFINVGLNSNTPNTRTNFLRYANEGKYDNTIIHRSVRAADPLPSPYTGTQNIDIIQGGGFTIDTAANTTGTVATYANINNEGSNSNAKGTIAMANAGVNTNNSQWYFNVKANTALDGGYTVFGAVLDASSQATLDAIMALDTSLNTTLPIAGNAYPNVPLRDIPAINARGSISPKVDYVIVYRAARLMDQVATSSVAPMPAIALAPTTNASTRTTLVIPPLTTNAPTVVFNDSNLIQGSVLD